MSSSYEATKEALGLTLAKNLHEPALFWLAGYFSGGITARAEIDTRIVKELQTIFYPNH